MNLLGFSPFPNKKINQSEENKATLLDYRSAITLFSVVEAPIEEKKALGESDLEDVLSRAAWNFFEENREPLARELDLSPLDLLLDDVRIVGVSIDGRPISGDVEFDARLAAPIGKMRLKIGFSFIKRESTPPEILAYEPGGLRAFLIKDALAGKEIILVAVGRESTSVYLADESSVRRLNTFGWEKKDILKSLRGVFSEDEEINNLIYLRYIEEEMGLAIKKKIDSVLKEPLGVFLNGVSLSVLSRLKKKGDWPEFFLFADFPLPDRIFKEKLAFLGREIKFNRVPETEPVKAYLNHEKVLAFDKLSQTTLKRIKWLMA